MSKHTLNALVAAKLDQLADEAELIHLQSWQYIQTITRKAAALLRANAAVVPDVRSTEFGQVAEKLADDYLELTTKYAGALERIAELEAAAVALEDAQ